MNRFSVIFVGSRLRIFVLLVRYRERLEADDQLVIALDGFPARTEFENPLLGTCASFVSLYCLAQKIFADQAKTAETTLPTATIA